MLFEFLNSRPTMGILVETRILLAFQRLLGGLQDRSDRLFRDRFRASAVEGLQQVQGFERNAQPL